jgi:hypothetical protein
MISMLFRGIYGSDTRTFTDANFNAFRSRRLLCPAWMTDYIAIFAFVACTTVGKAHLQAISGRDLQVIPSRVQLTLNAKTPKFLKNREPLIFQKLAGGDCSPPYQPAIKGNAV